MIILDAQGRVTDWNTGAEHLLGYTEQMIIGKHLSVFFTSEDRKLDKPKIELPHLDNKSTPFVLATE